MLGFCVVEVVGSSGGDKGGSGDGWGRFIKDQNADTTIKPSGGATTGWLNDYNHTRSQIAVRKTRPISSH